MTKRYVFHYNGDCKVFDGDERRMLEPGEMTYHEHLTMEDGQMCTVWLPFEESNGRQYADAIFDDGNELTVWEAELEEVR